MRRPRKVVAATLLVVAAAVLDSRPAIAQMDFSGEWAVVQSEDNTGNPHIGEFIGIPMSRAGLLRSQAWNASIYTLPEWQCRPHGAMYISRGPSQARIWKEVDPVSREIVAWHAEWLRSIDNPYYMDGRPRPPALAPHTWGGFGTAEYVGDMLRITVDHLKEDYYRRNGVPSSDQATVVSYYTRNENVLTVTWVVHDPLYLTEPYIKSADFIAAPRGVTTAAFGVEPPDRGNAAFAQCFPREEVARPDQHYVPHYLPGENPFVGELARRLGIPVEATLGGADTAYPEYKDRLRR